MKRLIIWVFFMVPAVCLVGPVWAAPNNLTGKEAPYFRVESGDGKFLDSRMIRGKVVVLFYECKEALPKSRPLKNVLNSFYHEQPKEIHDLFFVLPVINATSAPWPLKSAWKNALIEKSQKVGMTVYGDWDGRMGTTYAMKSDDTNLLIIDKKGFIRFFQSGVIEPEKSGTIISLLLQIASETHGNQKAKPL